MCKNYVTIIALWFDNQYYRIYLAIRRGFLTLESLQITKSVLWNFATIQVLLFLYNPKDLDPSYQTDLDFWDCFGRNKLRLITEEIRYIFLIYKLAESIPWYSLWLPLVGLIHNIKKSNGNINTYCVCLEKCKKKIFDLRSDDFDLIHNFTSTVTAYIKYQNHIWHMLFHVIFSAKLAWSHKWKKDLGFKALSRIFHLCQANH